MKRLLVLVFALALLMTPGAMAVDEEAPSGPETGADEYPSLDAGARETAERIREERGDRSAYGSTRSLEWKQAQLKSEVVRDKLSALSEAERTKLFDRARDAVPELESLDDATLAEAAAAEPGPQFVEPFRISGANRYETAMYMALLIEAVWNDLGESVPIVFLATGQDFPDALAAGSTGWPILLTRGDSLPPETLYALQFINPQYVVILGGTGAVSGAVEREIQEKTLSDTVRLAGPSRYDTAVVVSEVFESSSSRVYLATGQDFPDALAAGSPAAVDDLSPILLTRKDSLPDSTRAEISRLFPLEVVVLGGSGAISDEVLREAGALAQSGAIRRAGSDRYSTAVLAGQPAFGFDNTYSTFLATGRDFPDALAAAPTAYWWFGPVLLMRPTCMPSIVTSRLETLQPVEIAVAGGSGVIQDGAWFVGC